METASWGGTPSVILEVKAKPGAGKDVLASLKEMLPDTRRYDGCRGFDTYQDQDNPDTVVLIGQWESRGHHEKYLAWRQETGAVDKFVALLEGPPNLRYFDLTDA